jgi:hypothetical protein
LDSGFIRRGGFSDMASPAFASGQGTITTHSGRESRCERFHRHAAYERATQAHNESVRLISAFLITLTECC